MQLDLAPAAASLWCAERGREVGRLSLELCVRLAHGLDLFRQPGVRSGASLFEFLNLLVNLAQGLGERLNELLNGVLAAL